MGQINFSYEIQIKEIKSKKSLGDFLWVLNIGVRAMEQTFSIFSC